MEKSFTTTTRYTDGDYEVEFETVDGKPESLSLWSRESGEARLLFQFASADGDVIGLVAQQPLGFWQIREACCMLC